MEGRPLEKLIHTWKSFSSHELTKRHARIAPVWQTDSFDRVIRDDADLGTKIDYIAGNPAKRWPDAATPYELLFIDRDEAGRR